MKHICINAGSYGMFLFRYILLEFKKQLSDEEPIIYLEKSQDDQEYVIVEELENGDVDILSDILVQYIFKIYQPEIIGSIIGNLSGFYDYADRYQILDKTKGKLVFYQDKIPDYQKAAHSNIVELLHTQGIFNIEGFIVFRLKEYIFFLRKLVEEAMDDFLSEKEHAEFMRMLAYFVDMQEPRTDTVHIVHDGDCCFNLYDAAGNRYYFHDQTTLIENITLRDEAIDVLIGMLISLLPERIIIHQNQKRQQLSDILTEIFSYRVEVCNKCPDCTLMKNVLIKG
jgi:putative sporulation protein YtxC